MRAGCKKIATSAPLLFSRLQRLFSAPWGLNLSFCREKPYGLGFRLRKVRAFGQPNAYIHGRIRLTLVLVRETSHEFFR